MGRGRLSSFNLLPTEAEGIVAWAASELADREKTQTDIYAEFVDKCEALMAEHRGELEFTIPAFSSFNRFSIRQARMSARLTETREIVAVLAQKHDAKASDDLTIIAGEMIKSVVLHMLGDGADGVELPANYMFLPRLQQAALMAPFLEDLDQQLAALDLTDQFAFGFDFARVADLTAGSLMAVQKRLKRREVLAFELRNVPGIEQKLITRKILQRVRHRLVGAAFDATGMGWTVAEDMGREFGLREDPEGSGLVMAVKFSEEWYRLHMPPLKAAIEDDMLDLIADAEHLGDLRTIKLIRGIARVPALREGTTGKKRHGDHAIAVALAHWASRQRWVEYGYQPVPPPKAANTPARGMGMYSQDEADDAGAQDLYRAPLGATLRGSV